MTASTATETTSLPAATGAAPGAGTSPTNATSTMDASFIERNQIVERYLSGRLPARGAADFERFCRDNPQALAALGLPDRIHAGLRLMDAAGHPEPWAEKAAPFHQKPLLFAGLAALAGTMLIATLMLLFNNGALEKQVAVLEDQLKNQPLDPAESTRSILITPSRTGPVSRPLATLGGSRAELADMKIDVSWSNYKNFRVTIDRLDQGRVAVLGNLQRDSNGHLRLALNSSALGPGDYSITMEGLDWRGSPVPQAWLNFAVAR